jgi:hypothetical protein
VIAVDVALDGRMTLTCTPWPPNSVPPGTYDPLPVTTATVRAVLDIITASSTFDVSPSCATQPAINCPNGVPTPTQMHAEQVSVTISQATGTTFNFTVLGRMATVSDAVLSFGSTICGLNLDTTRFGAPTMTVTGTAVFDSNPPPDPPNRVRFTNVNVTGIETADLIVTGGGICPSVASFAITGLEQQLATKFSPYCGAPGAALLTPCQ